MSQDFDPELSGALFKNDKGDNPKRPDMTGNCQIDGDKYKIAAWVRESKKTGKKFYSLKFEKDEPIVVDVSADVSDDEIPF